MIDRFPTTKRFAAISVVLLIHVGLLAFSASRHSPVIDEVGHLPAGLSHWQFQKFDLYSANPPLVRAIAVIPVLVSGYHEDWSGYSSVTRTRSEFVLGKQFVEANPDSFMNAFRMARWMCIPFSLLGACVCFCWARELFGESAGWTALILWCTSPNVLGHASLITPDVGATAFGAAACYAFHRWLNSPAWINTVIVGVLLGLAELTKFTWIVLYPLIPSVWLLARLFGSAPAGWFKVEGTRIFALLCISLYVVNLGYGFEGTGKQLGKFEFSSRILSAGSNTERYRQGNRFRGQPMGWIPIPIPENMLLGIDQVKHEYEGKYWSYLRGEHRYGGWWCYYLYAMLVKIPLGTWAMLLLAISAMLRDRRSGTANRGVQMLVVVAPPIAIVALVSSQMGFNHHLRYVLPAFPFLFIFASQAASACRLRNGLLRRLPIACLAMTITSSLMCFPSSLSYFNEAVGGPSNGWKHLSFSNFDWGQDLAALAVWQRSHPEATPLYVRSTNVIASHYYGIKGVDIVTLKDSTQAHGSKPSQWYAVGVDAMLRRPQSPFASLLDETPVDHVGYSIRIYRRNEEPIQDE